MIYLLRHGQTDYNRDGRLQGQTDSQLTSLGMAQVQAMANVLAEQIGDVEGWRILASPLRRTRQSVAIVARSLRLPVEIDPALIEVGCGSWENRMYADLRVEQPEAFAGRDWVFNSPDGERFEDVDGRVRPWLQALPPEGERKVIAVSHGIAGSLMRGAYLGLSQEETLGQDTPQDAIFRLAGGAVDRLPCAPVAA
ncbi:MAG: histidine phosphatase family protein [Phenylobacterium sp.]